MHIFRNGAAPIVAAFFVGCIMSSPTASADMIIDNFTGLGDGHPWPLSVSSSSPSDGGIEFSVTGVLGGTRQSALDLLQVQAPFDNANANIYPTFGLLDFNSTSGAGARLALTYPGVQGLNADFSTEAGININFVAFDLGSALPTAVNIELYDGVNFASLTRLLSAAGPQTTQFSFADFLNIGSLDLASIDQVKVTFNVDGNLGVDFRVQSIRTYVPTPGALALLALAGLTTRRRRR